MGFAHMNRCCEFLNALSVRPAQLQLELPFLFQPSQLLPQVLGLFERTTACSAISLLSELLDFRCSSALLNYAPGEVVPARD